MFTFNPDTPEPVSANSLLAILSDPKTFKKHMEEYLKHQELVSKQTADLNTAREAHDVAKMTAESTLSAVEKLSAETKTAIENHRTNSANKEQELNDRERAVAEQERITAIGYKELADRHNQLTTDLSTRENNVSVREREITHKENDIRSLQNDAQRTKELYETKMANLRDALRVDYVLKAETGHIGANM